MPSEESAITININPDDYLKVKIIPLSVLVENISMVKLETSDSSLISEVTSIEEHKDKLFIYDRVGGNLIVFNEQGKFLYKIGERGSRPGQFHKVDSWCFDSLSNRIICIDDFQHKIKIFTEEGTFVTEFFTNVYSTKIQYLDNEHIVLYNNFNSANENFPYNLIFLNLKDNKVDRMELPIDPVKSRTFLTAQTPFVTNSQGLFYNFPYSYDIYKIATSSVEKKYHINFSNHSLPKEIMTLSYKSLRDSLFSSNQYIQGLTDFFVTKEVVMFRYIYKEHSMTALYNILDTTLKIYSAIDDDINALPINKLMFSNHNNVYIPVRASEFYNILNMYNTMKIPPKSSLLKIAKIFSRKDNPILLKCQLK